jgi:hypothetical protein
MLVLIDFTLELSEKIQKRTKRKKCLGEVGLCGTWGKMKYPSSFA